MDPQPKKPRNVTIACEACRRQKIRCNGAQPCGRRDCQDQPRACVYRRRARTRRSQLGASTEPERQTGLAAGTISDEEDLPAGIGYEGPPASAEPPCSTGPSEEAYPSSITAAHHAPRSTDSSQLFYGPSSNFAFLQEIRRAVLSAAQSGVPAGLEALLQRSIFFGIPHRVDPDTIWASEAAQLAVPVALAREFLDTFKTTSLHRLPFYTRGELDELFDALAEEVASPATTTATTPVPPQTRATFLAVLALGALGTAHTDAAEALYVRAKRVAVVLDEVVSLQMIWFAILLADYQINLGRPNAAYLHIGTACRKAFSFGLHTEAAAAAARSSHRGDDLVRKHHLTIWILYFYETIQSLSMGRNSSMRMCDISCPRPTEPALVVRLCELAHIMEATSDTIYRRTTDSLRQLYRRAEDLYRRLRRFADAYDIGSSYVDFSAHGAASGSTEKTIISLTLHSSYYLAVILVFRPFLVSSYAIQSGTRHGAHDDMWLHQACRHAVNAAQDCIRFTSDALQKVEACRKTRFQCFFIECTCGVLLYDILREPATYAYNMGFLRTALAAMGTMVADEPVVTAIKTTRQIAQAIEKAGTAVAVSLASDDPLCHGEASRALEARESGGGGGLSIPATGEPMVYLQECGLAPPGGSVPAAAGGPLVPAATAPPPYLDAAASLGPSPIEFSTGLDFDVLATDLFNFFPSGYVGTEDLAPPPSEGQ